MIDEGVLIRLSLLIIIWFKRIRFRMRQEVSVVVSWTILVGFALCIAYVSTFYCSIAVSFCDPVRRKILKRIFFKTKTMNTSLTSSDFSLQYVILVKCMANVNQMWIEKTKKTVEFEF